MAWWHPLDIGFVGRRPLKATPPRVLVLGTSEGEPPPRIEGRSCARRRYLRPRRRGPLVGAIADAEVLFFWLAAGGQSCSNPPGRTPGSFADTVGFRRRELGPLPRPCRERSGPDERARGFRRADRGVRDGSRDRVREGVPRHVRRSAASRVGVSLDRAGSRQATTRRRPRPDRAGRRAGGTGTRDARERSRSNATRRRRSVRYRSWARTPPRGARRGRLRRRHDAPHGCDATHVRLGRVRRDEAERAVRERRPRCDRGPNRAAWRRSEKASSPAPRWTCSRRSRSPRTAPCGRCRTSSSLLTWRARSKAGRTRVVLLVRREPPSGGPHGRAAASTWSTSGWGIHHPSERLSDAKPVRSPAR